MSPEFVTRPGLINADGRAISSEHGSSGSGIDLTNIDYSFIDDSVNPRVTVTNELGKNTTYHYATINGIRKVTQVEGHASANCLAANQSTSYDTNGYKDIVTDRKGNITDYDYNSRGLEVQRIEGSGTLEARTITTEWHPTYRLPTKITETDLETTNGYDVNGNLLTLTRKDLNTLETRIISQTYNNYGQILTQDGPITNISDITTYTYHNCSTGNNCGQLETITNALGHQIQFTQYNATGQPTHITDINGIQTVLVYDNRQRLISSTVDGLYTTLIDYDDVGQVTRITSPNGSYLDYEHDDARRLTAIEDALGNRIIFNLDNAGNRIQVDVRDSSGVLSKTQSSIHDELSRVFQELGANGQSSIFTFDDNGNIASVSDVGKPATNQQYDALNRLIQITDENNGITLYTYDPNDRIKTVTDPNGLVTTYNYNGFGDLISTISPDTGTTSYSVDQAGNILTETDARGKVSIYTYDVLSRKLTASFADTSLNMSYVYDQTAYGNFGVGRLTGNVDGSGSTSYLYNSRGLLASMDTVIGAVNYTVAYTYDASGQVKDITYPSSRIVSYQYDSANRITSVTATKNGQTTSIASNIAYSPFGSFNSLTYGNGLAETKVYDQDYRLSNIVSSNVLNRSYGYDLSNNITGITDNINALYSELFDYDYLDRLTDATGSLGDLDYSYDATNNRTSMTLDNINLDTYSYSLNSHRLDNVVGVNPQSFSYDVAGNMINRNGITQAFDDRGRLSSVTSGVVTTSYEYNVRGERVQKITSSGNTNYVYGNGLLMVESSGNSSKEYIYLNGQPLAVWNNDTGPPQTESLYFFHNDHLGTPQVMTDQNQTVVWQADYNPFGYAAIITSNIDNNIRFPGQYYDGESGLHYNYYRYYDPSTGRYITSDPIGLAGGLNTYAYVGGNPINRFDTLGLTEEQIIHALTLVNESQIDLDVPNSINVSPLFGFGEGITNPITRSITIGDYYLNENLDCNGMRSLVELIIHESIHRSGTTSDMITRPFDHPDIYDEAAIRFNELETLLNGRTSEECGCPVN